MIGSPVPLEGAILRAALDAGLTLTRLDAATLERHAQAVLAANEELHLTSITDPEEFVRRHVAESLAGAALLPPDASGPLVDLGTGNGYPGIPLVIARPGLSLSLVEASRRKATFLSRLVGELELPGCAVRNLHVQRAADLEWVGPIAVLATRAMGGWHRTLPKLARCMAPGGRLLLWAGSDLDRVIGRVAWRRWRLTGEHPLPGLERARLAVFEASLG